MTSTTGPDHKSPSERPRSQWIRDHYPSDVTIVIVNYKTKEVLRQCLSSLANDERQSSIEVVVVDNASGDGSVEMIAAEFPHVECLASKVNLGHSGGCNLGMAAARGRYLFLLNTDTRMQPGTIDRLVSYLDRHAGVAAAAPRVLNADGTLQGTIKRFPSPAAAIAGRYSLLARIFPKNRLSRRYLVYLDQDYSAPFRVDSASAAALMVRREAIAEAGPLDERFFLYWNDVDWCRSFAARGYEVHCVPDAVLVHDQHKGGTERDRRQSRRSAVDFHVGAYRYFHKWHTRRWYHPMNAVAILGLAGRAAIVIATGEIEHIFGLSSRREVTIPDPGGRMPALRDSRNRPE